jgi:hypothetical protein
VKPGTGEGDEGFEVGFEFFVASGEAAEVLESGEAAFDAIALSIEFFIVAALLFAVGFGRDHGDHAHGLDVVEDDLAVVALVGQHPEGSAISEKIDSLGSLARPIHDHRTVENSLIRPKPSQTD